MVLSQNRPSNQALLIKTLTLLGEGWIEFYFCTMKEELAKEMENVSKTRKKRGNSTKIYIYF